MIRRSRICLAIFGILLLALAAISCGSTNQNAGRVLTSIAVTPTQADASQYPNGQVTFVATGTFSIPPLSGPVTFTSPYTGSFFVANPSGGIIATVVATGTGTVTVQCVSGVSSSVYVVASASANNGTQTVVTGQGLLTCP
ncbi:MAG TPA: hypothetical protein VE377_01395 [Candidatus Dormibacteraeota bacterium]|nr:hypothetical protein [Candidatus Dormibacteraeota bacterium]